MEGLATLRVRSNAWRLNHVHGLDHLGYGTYQTPLSASDRLQVARRRVRLIFGDLGIIEQQLNQSSNQLGSCLCPVVMHYASDWCLFRVLLDRFLLPTIRPRFQEQRTTGHTQSALHSALQCGVTGLCAKTLGVLFLYVSKCRACFFPPTTRRYDRFSHS